MKTIHLVFDFRVFAVSVVILLVTVFLRVSRVRHNILLVDLARPPLRNAGGNFVIEYFELKDLYGCQDP